MDLLSGDDVQSLTAFERLRLRRKERSVETGGMHTRVGKLTGLQAMRGVAALLVVLHHAAGTLALPKYADVAIAGGLLTPLGRAGVDLFFVLSGFVIYYVHRADIGRAQSFRRYMLRRLVRIYPTYWVVLFLMLALFLGHPSFGG